MKRDEAKKWAIYSHPLIKTYAIMVSVIIPVYNGECYLEQTIDSIRNQSLRDLEIILVDDGSTDNSHAIMERMAREDIRIRVFHQENRGPSAARNLGIENALGEWIYFIDADDVAHQDALLRLVSVAKKNNTRVVIGGIFEGEHEKWPEIKGETGIMIMTAKEALETGLYQKRPITSACGVLYSSEILRQHKFSESLNYEDLEIFPRVCLSAGSITYNPEPLYFYRQHPDSFVHTFSPRRFDSLIVTERILDLVSKEMPAVSPAARDRQMSAAFNVLLLIDKYRPKGEVPERYHKFGTTYEAIAEYCFCIIRTHRRVSLFNPSVRLKNKLGILLSYGGADLLKSLSRLPLGS